MANPNPVCRFQPGNPGRPKGSRNAIAESFLSAVHKHWLKVGDGALELAVLESPLGYCKMVASLLPQKFELTQIAAKASDSELLEIIRGAKQIEAEVVRLPNPKAEEQA